MIRSALQVAGVAVAVVAAALWFFSGPNLGWTRTTQERVTLDEVTGLENREHVPSFLPGVDFFVAGAVLGGLIAAVSLFFKRDKSGTATESSSQPPAVSS